MTITRGLVALAAVLLLVTRATAGDVYSQPHEETGLLLPSVRLAEMDRGETYAYDDFSLRETQLISEIQWKGGYLGDGGPGVAMFHISFHASAPDGAPLIGDGDGRTRGPAIARYEVHGNANETYAGSYDGIAIYRYHFALPRPLMVQGGMTYWVCIQAVQHRALDWGMADGMGGNDHHFAVGPDGAWMDRNDLSFALLATWTNLGFAHEGSLGLPLLSGQGLLEANRVVSLQLDSARPQSPALLFIGSRAVSVPFKGGTLVPDSMLVVPLMTTLEGELELSTVLRDRIVPGTSIYLQYWILDPAASEGVSASNALEGTSS